jgi:HK97 family phage portal protein
MVEACISAYAQTVAMCPGDHWLRLDNGGRERVTTSALSRILRHPNEYQSISDFMMNATRSLYMDGNAYALALRNDRFEVDELHLMDPRQSSPSVVAETGEVFYRLGGNSMIDRRMDGIADQYRLGSSERHLMVPARDVLHIRLHTLERTRWPWPLVGETPLVAAYGAIEWYESMKNQQKKFFENEARPSAVLSTDLVLDKDQVQALRDRWNEQAKGLHAGGVPILTAGLKVQPWNVPGAAKDMQIAELLRLTQEQIALVFRIPLAVLGLGGGPSGTTEQLMGFWLASGLGFCLNHIEEAFGVLFNLYGQPDEYVEFNTAALLRSAQKDRIDMLVRGVQGGVFSPNEARAQEDLPEVKYGEEPRVQQQVVPLSAAGAIETQGGGVTPGVESATVPGAPSSPPSPPAAAQPLRGDDEDMSKRLKRLSELSTSQHLRLVNREADRYDRRRIA